MQVKSDIHPSIQTILSADEWRHRQSEHLSMLTPVLDPYLEERSRQIKNPVLDFLFEYYHFRPTHLLRWTPGLGKGLISNDHKLPEISELEIQNELAYLNPDRFPSNRIGSIKWISEFLKESAEKKPSFGCFGIHEWAMVYRTENFRHNHIPLRMSKDELAEFVESRPLVCTHFDAFRFFTSQAKPMNKYPLNRETFIEKEQPGCIHTNMDLYKWSFKMYPWISSRAIRDAFFLALEARTIDMQASPYDLRKEGLEPIRIETDEGRKIYLEKQQTIFKKSIPVRRRLIEEYSFIIDCIS